MREANLLNVTHHFSVRAESKEVGYAPRSALRAARKANRPYRPLRLRHRHRAAIGSLLEISGVCTLRCIPPDFLWNGSSEMTVIERVASEQAAQAKMPPGVLFEGPVVDAKFRDSYISFALMIGGSIGAL